MLNALRANTTSLATEMKCSPAPWKGRLRALVTPEWITLSDGNRLVREVAVAITKSGWRPVLGIQASGARNLKLRGANGVIRCRGAKPGVPLEHRRRRSSHFGRKWTVRFQPGS